MNNRLLSLALGLTIVTSRSFSALAQEPPSKPKDAVAVVGDAVITDSMLELRASERLSKVRAETYAIKKQVLEAYIVELLLEREARARGVSVADLQQQEIRSKVQPVSEDAKRAVLESNPLAYATKSEQEALSQIESRLRGSRESEVRRKFVLGLREQAGVKVFLDPPRVAIKAQGQPFKGPAEAPVTLVVFSDYQCPYCTRLEPELKQLNKRYEKQLKVVFRDFPLEQIHSDAAKAAEAADCADEQGKFWEMNGKLFENPRALTPPDLKRVAGGLGLDGARFGECLDSGRMAKGWQKDVKDGQRYGVTGTPSIFINGRLFRGAASLRALSDVVDEELAMTMTRTQESK